MTRSSATTSRYAALVVDYGGVLTTPLQSCLEAYCEADGVAPEDLRAAIGGLGGDLVRDLETGRLPIPEFERRVAGRLRTRAGEPVDAAGLLRRMFSGFSREATMLDVLRGARAAGVRTGLLSNSWGNDYPREDWHELFDDVVISGEVGLRKPEPEIYLLAATRLGVDPAACVFVDDLAVNVRGAAAAGMCGIHHVGTEQTLREIEALFGTTFVGT